MPGRATTASLDHRVARVEADVSLLSSRFDDFRTSVRESLARIETAVTTPNAADAATTVMIADMTRRLAATEADSLATKNENKALRSDLAEVRTQVRTVGTIAKSVGISGVLGLIGLVVVYVNSTGKLP